MTVSQRELWPQSWSARARSALARLRSESWILPLLLFGVHLLLVFPFFLPSLREINPWDEAAYIEGGRRLIEGSVPSLAENPLVALLYGMLYLVFRPSPFWLILGDWAGRAILFCALWASAYAVGISLERWAPPLLVPGFLLVLPLTTEILTFPSDPLFAALSGLSLAQLIRFESSGEIRHLRWASVWVGLAALARSDGLLLALILIVAGLGLAIRRKKLGEAWKAALGPAVLVVAGYAVLAGLARGDFRTGLAERTYENFESGQQLIYAGGGEVNPVIESREEARRVFGTPEENGYSVFRAIERNPAAYLARLKVVTAALPEIALRAYGIRFAPVVLLFVVAGVVELLRKKQIALWMVLVLWPLHLVSGFLITLFRPGHLQFAWAPVLGLAAVGLAAEVRRSEESRRVSWVMVGLAVGIAYGVLAEKTAIGYGAMVLGIGLVVAVWLFRRLSGGQAGWIAAGLTLLAAGIVLHGNYPSPRVLRLGDLPEERALVYLGETFPRGSLIAAGSPGVVWAARMTYAGLAASDVPRGGTSGEFLHWMEASGIRAVYVDHTLSGENPQIWDLISQQIGSGLRVGFLAEEGDIQVLLLEGAPPARLKTGSDAVHRWGAPAWRRLAACPPGRASRPGLVLPPA